MKNDYITLRILNIAIFVTVGFSLFLFIFSIYYILSLNTKLELLEKQRNQVEKSANVFVETSSLLSRFVWKFAETQDSVFAKQYFNEYGTNKNREKAVINILMFPLSPNERSLLLRAKKESDALVYGEVWAMRLIADSAKLTGMPEAVKDFPLAVNEQMLSSVEKNIKATRYLFGIEYNSQRQVIIDLVRILRLSLNNRYANNALLIIERITTFSIMSGILLVSVLVILLAVIAYHKKIEEKLRLKLQKTAAVATKANLAKSDFLSRMSHDFRTPMNAIIGLSLKVQDRTLADAEMCLEKINSAGIHLLQLINDTLDMSKIESKKLELKPVPISFEEIRQTINTIILPAAQAKGIRFIIDAGESPLPIVLADRLRMNQILLNLLNNAVKFTPQGGVVSLLVRVLERREGKIRYALIVRDTGKGINEAFQKKLFVPFEQEDCEQQGTGLGLAIVKNIVECMGGAIDFSSKPGKGTEFVVTLESPVAEGYTSQAVVNASASGSFGDLHVLLVEDHDINALVAVRLLKQKGIVPERARNGQEALDMFMRSPEGYYDLLLMDIRMPIMDGLEATRRLRALPRRDAATVPVIAMTANAFDEDIELSLRSGMDAHVSKPIKPELLFAAIERAVMGKKADAEASGGAL